MEARSLESMEHDYTLYKMNGRKLKDAKHYNNVIDERVLKIPISQVRIYVYIMLKLKSLLNYVGQKHLQ
jgi:hypothetical protein